MSTKTRKTRTGAQELQTAAPNIPIPDKTTVELAEHLARVVESEIGLKGFSPFEVIAVVAADARNDASLRLKAAATLALYYRPQIKGIDTQVNNTQVNFIIEASDDGR